MNNKKFGLYMDLVLVIISLMLVVLSAVMVYYEPSNVISYIWLVTTIFMLLYNIFNFMISDKTTKHICKKCGKTFYPTARQVFFAPHFGFAKYCKCPNCQEKSWNKKAWNVDENDNAKTDVKTDEKEEDE